MNDDHIEHFEAGARIERAKAIREERQCSMQEAVAIERREFLTRRIEAAKSVDDIKLLLLDLLRG